MRLRQRRTDHEVDAEEGARPADHVAAVARALVSMGTTATSISTRLPMRPDQAEEIGRLLPSLAARLGLLAEYEWEGQVLSVTFTKDV